MASRSSYNHLAANSRSPAGVRPASRNPPHSSRRIHPFAVFDDLNTKIKDRQFSVLVLVFLINLFFWCSMIYAIIDIDNHHSHRNLYFIVSLLVFLVPSTVAAVLLLGPCPGIIKQWSTSFDTMRHSKNYLLAVNVFNATFCLIILIVYLYASAIPQYENAQWENQFTYQQYLPIPSFALVDWDDYTIAAPGRYFFCYLNNATAKKVNNCTHAIQWTTVEGHQTFLFNSSKLAADENSLLDLLSSITLSTIWTYDAQKASENSQTSSGIAMVPTFFDPRMSLDTLINCGLVGQPLVTASAEYSISLTASYTTDKYNLITRPGQSPDCVSASQALLADTQSPYISYSASFGSTQVNTNCDQPANGTVASCVFSAIVNFNTQMVQTTASIPGISKLNIVLNAGSLVGGVQFFAWFLAMFAAP